MTDSELLNKLNEIEGQAKQEGRFPLVNVFVQEVGLLEATLFKFAGETFDNEQMLKFLFDNSLYKRVKRVWWCGMIYFELEEANDGKTNLSPEVVERIAGMVAHE